ncbi:MAG TPA: lysophospholipid acyltransferase family protein [Clostridia bacterium]
MVNVIRFFVGVVLRILYRVKFYGISNIPEKGAAVMCPNHIAELDMCFIGFKIKRLIRWMAKEELFKVPLFGKLLRYLGAFPIKRGKADVESIRTALGLLSEGHIVGVFPEGTRTARAGNNVKVKRGAVLLALKAGVPVIPVAINASYKLFSRVTVTFGEPIRLEGNEENYSNDEMIQITKGIMDRIYGLLEEK